MPQSLSLDVKGHSKFQDDFKLEDTVPLSDPILPESPPEEDPTAFYQHLFDAENDENAVIFLQFIVAFWTSVVISEARRSNGS